eukprot:TRINITY_DN1444_c0_g4_i2.p2 TRINITY_DN1444_c0_g4~~TRINITY_DN1444_c0_g4_i2.p2  ORF type:complete len:110 (-),score=48.17 TRINITY_DN1444_c0_g4_i2:347-676(-)
MHFEMRFEIDQGGHLLLLVLLLLQGSNIHQNILHSLLSLLSLLPLLLLCLSLSGSLLTSFSFLFGFLVSSISPPLLSLSLSLFSLSLLSSPSSHSHSHSHSLEDLGPKI